MENKLISKHIRMSGKVAKWYEDKSKEIGVSQTNLMVMALNEYIKQDQVIDMVDIIKLLQEDTQKRE